MATFPGWKPLIVCDGPDCHINEVFTLIKNAIHDLVLLSTLLVVVALIYAGFKLLASQGNSGALTEVKTMFGKIILGYAVILTAWVIIYSITSVLLKPGFNQLISG